MPQKTSWQGLQKDRQHISKIKNHFKTQAEFVLNFNHLTLEQRYSDVRTVDKAYQTKYVTLKELTIIYKEETPKMLIESWIMQLSMLLDLPISKEQISELSWLIYDDNHYLNIAEMTLLFKRIKKGYYGQFFGRIDPTELLRWCREYRNERGRYIASLPDDYKSPVLEKAKEEYEKKNQNIMQ